MLKNCLALISILFFPSTIFSDGYYAVKGSWNSGQHVFETGNKYPNLSGIRGGSRITYSRNFPSVGVEGGWFWKKFAIYGSITTSGYGWKTPKGRDEDFYLYSISTEQKRKLIPENAVIHDTVNTFTGSNNFADGKAKSSMTDIQSKFQFRWYPGSGQASIWGKEDGWFLATGINYINFKYYLYDVTQYIARPLYNAPIGNGLSYTYTSWELPMGGGYSWRKEKFALDASLFFLYSYSLSRDFHYQRALNFLSYGTGLGFIYKLDAFWILNESRFLKFSFSGHRQFTYGAFHTTGGASFEDYASNYAGAFKAYINTKETLIEFAYAVRFGQEEQKKDSPPPHDPIKQETPPEEKEPSQPN